MKRFALLFSFIFSGYIFAATEVTDMSGRKITLPEKIEKSFASAPPMGLLSYILAPETMTAMNLPIFRKINALSLFIQKITRV